MSVRDLKVQHGGEAKYELANYDGLRSPENFARGCLFGRAELQKTMLMHAPSKKLPRSLMDLSPELSGIAVGLFETLRAFLCKEKYSEKDAASTLELARHLVKVGKVGAGMVESGELKGASRGLACCLEDSAGPRSSSGGSPLRDELYCQLMKEITGVAGAYRIRGLQLLSLYVSQFPPSKHFELYVLHFVMNLHQEKADHVRVYGRYCLACLLDAPDGDDGDVPDLEAISAYQDREPTLVL